MRSLTAVNRVVSPEPTTADAVMSTTGEIIASMALIAGEIIPAA
jgi:hypothetical protein